MEQEIEALNDAIENFERGSGCKAEVCRAQAVRFGVERFDEAMLEESIKVSRH